VHEAVKALALCHNVTPVLEDEADGNKTLNEVDGHIELREKGQGGDIVYQASSPDEVLNTN